MPLIKHFVLNNKTHTREKKMTTEYFNEMFIDNLLEELAEVKEASLQSGFEFILKDGSNWKFLFKVSYAYDRLFPVMEMYINDVIVCYKSIRTENEPHLVGLLLALKDRLNKDSIEKHDIEKEKSHKILERLRDIKI